MRPRARVTSKGRVIIPKEVRERLGLRPGDEVEYPEDQGGFRLQKHFPESPSRKYPDYLKHLAGHDSGDLVEQMRCG